MTKYFEDLRFYVEANPRQYIVDFRIYEVPCNDQDGTPLFQRKDSNFMPDPVSSTTDAEVYISGFVKFDGCSNWNFDEQDRGTMLHGCNREDLTKIGEVMARCWDWASELIPGWCGEA